MISVVIRAKNEEDWMGRCLFALAHQSLGELDLILVDNESSDATVEIARSQNVRICSISASDFTYGRALNLGIDMARHECVALLSAHCVPATDLWAAYFLAHFEADSDRRLCGVYGRQEPLPETQACDRRDLWTTFRDERTFQYEDYFFHNANSAIRKSLWLDHPFDEEISGVEDRAWAKKMIGAGYHLAYEPHARVYHHHGIHQGGNESRAKRVAQVIEHIRSMP